MVYKLVAKFEEEGTEAYKPKRIGRHKRIINPAFIKKVVEQRKQTDYGSQKLHFIFKEQGFGVSQHTIQRILDEQQLTEPCEKRRGQESMLGINGQ
jgi:transposase